MSSTPYEAVDIFEKSIAEYAGSKYGVAVDSCCNALFLSMIYHLRFKCHAAFVEVPKITYPGVACSMIHAGIRIKFVDLKWSGIYELSPFNIYDSALRFKRNMYIKNSLYCLSFHVKKHLPIGRGGMILTDDELAYKWLKKARFDGRNPVPLDQDKIDMTGWNMYLTPEQASRGLTLFEVIKDRYLSDIDMTKQGYPDLSKIKAYA